MHGYLYTEHKFNFCASLSAGHTDSVEGGRQRLGDCPVPSFLPDWTMYVTVPTTRLNDIHLATCVYQCHLNNHQVRHPYVEANLHFLGTSPPSRPVLPREGHGGPGHSLVRPCPTWSASRYKETQALHGI